jgi:hypothetical protein
MCGVTLLLLLLLLLLLPPPPLLLLLASGWVTVREDMSSIERWREEFAVLQRRHA